MTASIFFIKFLFSQVSADESEGFDNESVFKKFHPYCYEPNFDVAAGIICWCLTEKPDMFCERCGLLKS